MNDPRRSIDFLRSQIRGAAFLACAGLLSACTEPIVEPVVRDDRDDKIRQLEAENQRLREAGNQPPQSVSTEMPVERIDSSDPFKVVSSPPNLSDADPFADDLPTVPSQDSREDVWKSLIGEALYEVKLSDGSILPGGTIRRVNATEVLLSHANGIAVLKLAETTPKIQKMCLYDPSDMGAIAVNSASTPGPVPIGNVGGFSAQPQPEPKPAPRMVKMPPKKVYARKIPDETTLRLKISRAKAKVESLKEEKITLRQHYETEDYRWRYKRISVRTSAAQRAKNLTDIDDEIGRQQGDIYEAETLLEVLAKRKEAEIEAARDAESAE